MARRPFKKDLTPIGKGGISKQVGKGAMSQFLSDETPLSGNRYPKPAPPTPPSSPADLPSAPAAMPSMPSTPPPMGSSEPDADDM